MTKSITLKGQKWKVQFKNFAQHNKLYGPGGLACVVPHKKIISFVTSEINRNIVKHELLHALMRETYIDYIDPDIKQIEEMACLLIEFHGDEIENWADRIMDMADTYISK